MKASGAGIAKAWVCVCVSAGALRSKLVVRRGCPIQSLVDIHRIWQVAIDKVGHGALQYQQSPFFMPDLRIALRNEASDNVAYGEALLAALRLKAQRQIELVTPDQHEDVIRLYGLILDIQAVQERLNQERYRLSTVRA